MDDIDVIPWNASSVLCFATSLSTVQRPRIGARGGGVVEKQKHFQKSTFTGNCGRLQLLGLAENRPNLLLFHLNPKFGEISLMKLIE